MAKHIMVDIETMGSSDIAAILSIGAVSFNYDNKDNWKEFYHTISLEDNFRHQRIVESATLEWWLMQSTKAREELISIENRKPYYYVMNDFIKFVKDNTSKKSTIWANGTNFDLRLLDSAFKDFDMKRPWSYKQEMDMRTIRHLDSTFLVNSNNWSYLKSDNKDILHNALEDAKLQAQFIHEFMHNLYQKLGK